MPELSQTYPQIKPGLFIVEAGTGEFFIGDGSEGIYIPVDPYFAIVRACNGSQTSHAIAQAYGISHQMMIAFINELRVHNYIEVRNQPPAKRTLDELANHYRDRLKPEHDLFTWRHSTDDGGVHEVASRKSFAIVILGENRLARTLLATLQASGFSQSRISSLSSFLEQAGSISAQKLVAASDSAKRIRAQDICGITTKPLDIGRKLSEINKEIVLSAQLSHVDSPTSSDIDLIISTSVARADLVQRWISEGIAHIQIAQVSTHSVEIGPLVLPGAQACLNCVQLHRRDQVPPFITLASFDALSDALTRELTSSSTSFIAGSLIPYICEFAARGNTALIAHSITINLLEPLHGIRHNHWNFHPECGCKSVEGLSSQELHPSYS